MTATPGSEVSTAAAPTRRAPGYAVTAVLAWLCLLTGVAIAIGSLSTILAVPHWIHWRLRLMLTAFSGESGYRYLPWVLVLVAAGVMLERRHRVVGTLATLAALFAATLLATPLAEAWVLGRSLPGRLDAAFGPGTLERAPFSARGLYAELPAPVPFKDGVYDGKHGMEFMPAIGRSPAPLVISLHGGAWFGSGFRDRRPFNLWLARQGYAVMSIAYSSLPQARWPEPRNDVLWAVQVARAHAKELGIDPNRIVLLGRSAGAQLALTAAYSAHDSGICGVVAFYPPTDLRDEWQKSEHDTQAVNGMTAHALLSTFLGGTPETAPAAFDSASAVTLVDRNSPPTLILHGRLDTMVPLAQSEVLVAKLRAADRPCLLVTVPWASHSFDTVNFNGPGGQISTYAVARFLASVTRDQGVRSRQ